MVECVAVDNRLSTAAIKPGMKISQPIPQSSRFESGSGDFILVIYMPIVKIDIWEGRDKDTKRKLIQSVAKAVSESLDVPVEHIHIVINEVSKDNFGLEGEQASRIR